jgi:hypothetical protein
MQSAETVLEVLRERGIPASITERSLESPVS